jgi:glycosyltransferase involved in cell wall biosynthesis
VRAVLFGTFNSRHTANVLLAEELRSAGIELRVCHEPLWEETRDKHDEYFSPGRMLGLALRWLVLSFRLALRFRYAAAGADIIVVGFNGQLDVLLARLLAGGRRVVFAPLVTLGETLIDDRQIYRETSLVGRLLRGLDRLTMAAADTIVMDTQAHADWLATCVGVAPEKIRVHLLGAEDAYAPAVSTTGRPLEWQPGPRLRVFGYASYLPLHGMEVVVAAARELRPEEGIAFLLVGSGPERSRFEAELRDLPHVTLEDWMTQDELVKNLREADAVLGIFGSSVKAKMVIPNKVWQAAQVGRAVVTADTPAVREVFVPGESIVATAAEGAALTAALRELAGDAARREALGHAAREAVQRQAGAGRRAERWRESLGLPARAQDTA